MQEITKNELAVIARAVELLHRRFGGLEWTVDVGRVAYSPETLCFFRRVVVNGVELTSDGT